MKTALLLLMLLLAFMTVSLGWAQNPLLAPQQERDTPTAHAPARSGSGEAPSKGLEPVEVAEEKAISWMPSGIFLAVVRQVMLMQWAFQEQLAEVVGRYKAEQSAWAASVVLLVSFAYGVFHAAGPGHGKVVTSTFVLTQRAQLRQGGVMSGIIALVQAGTAITLVSVIGLLPLIPRSEMVQRTVYLEMLSYLLIALLGAHLALRLLRGKGHVHHHGFEDSRSSGRSALLAAGIAGLRPCTGALLVLLFSLANGVYGLGIAATLAIGLGVWMTLSSLALGLVGVRESTLWLPMPHIPLLRPAIAFTGALTLVIVGLLLALGAWGRLGHII